MFLLSVHAQARLSRKAEPVTRTAESSRCLCLVSSGGQHREILPWCLEDRTVGGGPTGRVSAGSFYGPLTISPALTQLSSPFPRDFLEYCIFHVTPLPQSPFPIKSKPRTLKPDIQSLPRRPPIVSPKNMYFQLSIPFILGSPKLLPYKHS